MRILIAIKSCAADQARGCHDAIRESWALHLPGEVDLRFFMGEGASITFPDEVLLECPDGYDSLSWKTHKIAQWSTNKGYDFTFLCDNDTFVVPDRLLDDNFQWDYKGRFFFQSPIPWEVQGARFAFGGTGYWLSKLAASIVSCNSPMIDKKEDKYVGKVLDNEVVVKEANGDRWERWAAWHYTKGVYPDYPRYDPASNWMRMMTDKYILGLPVPGLAPIDQKTFPETFMDVPQVNPMLIVAQIKYLFESTTTPETLISLAATIEIQKKNPQNITLIEWTALAKAHFALGKRDTAIKFGMIASKG